VASPPNNYLRTLPAAEHAVRAQWRGPAVSFCPSNLTAENKSHRPKLCHPACPGLPWDWSEAQGRDLQRASPSNNYPVHSTCRGNAVEGTNVSFCRSDLTATNKSHRPKLCHPDRSGPGFPATRPSPASTCAAFRKESRMKFANATNLDRKSGEAQWRDLRCASPPNNYLHTATFRDCHPACPGLPWERSQCTH
jgi:hypothetical protein